MISTQLLAQIEFTPALIAALLAWILCVCLHEFSHALVAYLGGDASVRSGGYLTLDPFRFIDPIFSLLVPAIVLLMGGLPLPGGSVPINTLSLSRAWRVYVAAAGPASNFLIFLLLAAPMHPKLGIVDAAATYQPDWVNFCGAMAVLNFIATLFNLIPCPPLDGYRIIEHKLPREVQEKFMYPQAQLAAFAVLFLVLWTWSGAWVPFFFMLQHVTDVLGLPSDVMLKGYFVVFHNRLYE